MPFDIGAIGQGAGIAAAGDIVGAGMGLMLEGHNDRRQLRQQGALQQQQIQGQEQLTDYNMNKQLQMWKDTSYPAQIEQMQKAGINPALLYGQGGGGGQTANVNTGNIGAAQAQQNPGEIQAFSGMGIQAQQVAADVDLKKAEAENIRAQTPNLPKTGANIEASTASLLQGVQNQKAQEILTKVQTDIANIQKQIQGATIEEAIRTITAQTDTWEEQAAQAGLKTVEDKSTLNTKIDQAKTNLVATLLENELTKAQTTQTKTQTTLNQLDIKNYSERFAAELSRISHQNYADITNSGANQENAATNNATMQWNKFLHDIPDADKLPMDIMEKVGQAIIVGKVIGGRSPMNKIGYK